MPPKRKSAAADRKAAKSAKTDQPPPVPIASTHEKPATVVRTYADSWPNGLASWPAVLRAVAFYSLLSQKNERRSWSAALAIVAGSPDKIDLSLLPDDIYWSTKSIDDIGGKTSIRAIHMDEYCPNGVAS